MALLGGRPRFSRWSKGVKGGRGVKCVFGYNYVNNLLDVLVLNLRAINLLLLNRIILYTVWGKEYFFIK